MAKTAAAIAVAAVLAGCASTKELPPSEPQLVRASSAVIIPPPGGPAIVSVVSTTFTNAVRQDIFLPPMPARPAKTRCRSSRLRARAAMAVNPGYGTFPLPRSTSPRRRWPLGPTRAWPCRRSLSRMPMVHSAMPSASRAMATPASMPGSGLRRH
ncbi:cellulose biosynthesis protein BcsN [Devosia chinhatensis]|uniref:Cellulose biosynthesis protein BcsN n=1 Tax=Devosia aurantiaca TaxID=2714858 RepID=A0A6M1SM46_9HYPH|nr:cellulose biosynthesis protein BcsN [Devosia aurantiaca]